MTARPDGEKLWTTDFIRISIINLIIFISFQMINAAIPVYAKSIGANDKTVGLMISAISFAAIITRPFAGRALDTFGRLRVMMPALFVITLITFGYGLFGSIAMIIALRLLHGVVWGFSSTSVTTIASDIIPKRRFGEGMGYFTLSSSLALALAPLIGLSILEHWRFFTATTISAVLLAIAFLAGFTIKDSVGPRPKEGGPRPALFERTALWPAVMMVFITPCMASIASFAAIYGYSLGIDAVGPFFTIYACAMLFSRPLIGRIIDRIGFHLVVLSAFALMAAALLCLWQANNIVLFYLAGLMFGVGFAAAQTSFQTMTVLAAPEGRVGAANATFFMGFDAGIGIGGIAAGAIADQLGYANMYLSLIVLLVCATFFYVRFGWQIKR